MSHKEILLYGFHFSFVFVFILAVSRDIYFNNYLNAAINFTSLVLTCISYYFLHYKQKITLATNIIMATAVIPLYILIYLNHFENMVIVYVILLPLAAFYLMEFKKALFTNFLMYLLLVVMLYYIYTIHPQTPIINNPLALINIAFASILITFFGIFYHMSIASSMSALIHANRQKDILLKEVHHRVKNNLNVIASILGLQAKNKSLETQEELVKSKSRIESISTVHEMLYKQEDYEEIEFSQYAKKLTQIILNVQSDNQNISIDIKKAKPTLPLNVMIQLGLIINEMVTNTLKYAENKAGIKIAISLEKVGSQHIFTYRDNGEKTDMDKLKTSHGLGMKLIELSTKQLNGTISTMYDKGLVYQITF